MNALRSLHAAIFDPISRAEWILPTLARFVFAAVLLMYFWVAGLKKLGDGILGFLNPGAGAYAQIFPKAMEAVSYDITQLSTFHYLVVVAGTVAEFVLPLLIVAGLLTRLAALGMIGFVAVQSATDVIGHGGSDIKTLGAWFDRFPDAVILDQRAFWVVLLAILVIKGAGPISFDRALAPRQTG